MMISYITLEPPKKERKCTDLFAGDGKPKKKKKKKAKKLRVLQAGLELLLSGGEECGLEDVSSVGVWGCTLIVCALTPRPSAHKTDALPTELQERAEVCTKSARSTSLEGR